MLSLYSNATDVLPTASTYHDVKSGALMAIWQVLARLDAIQRNEIYQDQIQPGQCAQVATRQRCDHGHATRSGSRVTLRFGFVLALVISEEVRNSLRIS